MTQRQPTDGESQQEPTKVGHCKSDQTEVYIGRDKDNDTDEFKHLNNTEIGERGWLGNPYRLDDGYGREESVSLFYRDFIDRFDSDSEFRQELYELQGQTLGCWCRSVDEHEPLCHGDVIARVVDATKIEDEG